MRTRSTREHTRVLTAESESESEGVRTLSQAPEQRRRADARKVDPSARRTARTEAPSGATSKATASEPSSTRTPAAVHDTWHQGRMWNA